MQYKVVSDDSIPPPLSIEEYVRNTEQCHINRRTRTNQLQQEKKELMFALATKSPEEKLVARLNAKINKLYDAKSRGANVDHVIEATQAELDQIVVPERDNASLKERLSQIKEELDTPTEFPTGNEFENRCAEFLCEFIQRCPLISSYVVMLGVDVPGMPAKRKGEFDILVVDKDRVQIIVECKIKGRMIMADVPKMVAALDHVQEAEVVSVVPKTIVTEGTEFQDGQEVVLNFEHARVMYMIDEDAESIFQSSTILSMCSDFLSKNIRKESCVDDDGITRDVPVDLVSMTEEEREELYAKTTSDIENVLLTKGMFYEERIEFISLLLQKFSILEI